MKRETSHETLSFYFDLILISDLILTTYDSNRSEVIQTLYSVVLQKHVDRKEADNKFEKE